MKLKRIIWLIFSCVVVAGLVLASCGPVEDEKEEEVVKEEEEEEVTEEEEEEEEEVTTPDKPQYGGSITLIHPTDVSTWDGSLSISTIRYIARIVVEDLAGPDWAVGPAGTGEQSWVLQNWYPERYCSGRIAESWEFPEPGKIIFNIRQGVNWALDPGSDASRLVGGREVTADDVVFSIMYYPSSPTSFISIVESHLAHDMKAEKTGPSEVTVTIPSDLLDVAWLFLTHITPIIPPEVVEEYGNMAEWQNLVGTGPFMLTDFVQGSSANLERNPNYWEDNPVGPGKGDQLPYVDRLKYLIIPDVSTQMAAMRTGKADWISDVYLEDAQSLMKTTPEIEYISFLSVPKHVIYMRTDKTDTPYSSKLVRQALMMAIDHEAIKDDLYGGDAVIQNWPVIPLEGGDTPYVPLEDLPENVQELYGYNPEKAKQLLADAGYAEGFDTQIVCHNTTAAVDVLSVVKNMWAEINVNLEIQGKDYGVYRTVAGQKTHEHMLCYDGPSLHAWQNMPGIRGFALNKSNINDPEVEKLYWDTRDYVIKDEPKAAEIQREFWPYFLEQAYAIPLPEPYKFTMWWPWIKNYHGERGVSVNLNGGWVKYSWVDQELKQEMR